MLYYLFLIENQKNAFLFLINYFFVNSLTTPFISYTDKIMRLHNLL